MVFKLPEQMLRISSGRYRARRTVDTNGCVLRSVYFLLHQFFFSSSGCYLVRRHSKLIILLLERIRAHNTVHPIKRIDTEWQMLQHSCAPHNCSAPHSVVYSARDMCVWFHWLHLTSFTLLVFELTPRIRRRSVCNPQSTCRFVRMVYVYLLVIKSIDSFVPFYLALMTHETLSLSRLTQTQFRFDSQF